MADIENYWLSRSEESIKYRVSLTIEKCTNSRTPGRYVTEQIFYIAYKNRDTAVISLLYLLVRMTKFGVCAELIGYLRII